MKEEYLENFELPVLSKMFFSGIIIDLIRFIMPYPEKVVHRISRY